MGSQLPTPAWLRPLYTCQEDPPVRVPPEGCVPHTCPRKLPLLPCPLFSSDFCTRRPHPPLITTRAGCQFSAWSWPCPLAPPAQGLSDTVSVTSEGQ